VTSSFLQLSKKFHLQGCTIRGHDHFEVTLANGFSAVFRSPPSPYTELSTGSCRPYRFCAPSQTRRLNKTSTSIPVLPWPLRVDLKMLSVRRETQMLRDFLFLILFFMLLAIWAMAWIAFHVAGGLIHVLLIVAVISLILHLFRGRRLNRD
jgi:hypothetical protein